jgi:hypothetical protein
LNEQGAGSDEQGAVRASERGAERLDGAPIRLGGSRVVREVVNEGGVDHAIRSGRSRVQALEIFERTAVDIGSCPGKGRGSRVRAGEAEHLMPRVDQLADDGGTDEPCGAGDEDAHVFLLFQ